MTETTRRTLDAGNDAVWRILTDPWLLPMWLVGVTSVRQVDPAWPAHGARTSVYVGTWPVMVPATCHVTESDPGRLLAFETRRWPLGHSEIRLETQEATAGTTASLRETPLSGPGHLTPEAVRTPLLDWRNRESLIRLEFLARGRGQRRAA